MEKNHFESYILDINPKEINGKAYLDTDFIMYLFEFIKKLDSKNSKTPKNLPDKDQNVSKTLDFGQIFYDKVLSVWKDCLASGPNPWHDSKNIIGEALMVDYAYDPEKLAIHADEIYKLISMVHLATTYDDLKFLDNGEQWSELRQPLSFLMSLGNALKLIEFKIDRSKWDINESKNPKLTFKLK